MPVAFLWAFGQTIAHVLMRWVPNHFPAEARELNGKQIFFRRFLSAQVAVGQTNRDAVARGEIVNSFQVLGTDSSQGQSAARRQVLVSLARKYLMSEDELLGLFGYSGMADVGIDALPLSAWLRIARDMERVNAREQARQNVWLRAQANKERWEAAAQWLSRGNRWALGLAHAVVFVFLRVPYYLVNILRGFILFTFEAAHGRFLHRNANFLSQEEARLVFLSALERERQRWDAAHRTSAVSGLSRWAHYGNGAFLRELTASVIGSWFFAVLVPVTTSLRLLWSRVNLVWASGASRAIATVVVAAVSTALAAAFGGSSTAIGGKIMAFSFIATPPLPLIALSLSLIPAVWFFLRYRQQWGSLRTGVYAGAAGVTIFALAMYVLPSFLPWLLALAVNTGVGALPIGKGIVSFFTVGNLLGAFALGMFRSVPRHVRANRQKHDAQRLNLQSILRTRSFDAEHLQQALTALIQQGRENPAEQQRQQVYDALVVVEAARRSKIVMYGNQQSLLGKQMAQAALERAVRQARLFLTEHAHLPNKFDRDVEQKILARFNARDRSEYHAARFFALFVDFAAALRSFSFWKASAHAGKDIALVNPEIALLLHGTEAFDHGVSALTGTEFDWSHQWIAKIEGNQGFIGAGSALVNEALAPLGIQLDQQIFRVITAPLLNAQESRDWYDRLWQAAQHEQEREQRQRLQPAVRSLIEQVNAQQAPAAAQAFGEAVVAALNLPAEQSAAVQKIINETAEGFGGGVRELSAAERQQFITRVVDGLSAMSKMPQVQAAPLLDRLLAASAENSYHTVNGTLTVSTPAQRAALMELASQAQEQAAAHGMTAAAEQAKKLYVKLYTERDWSRTVLTADEYLLASQILREHETVMAQMFPERLLRDAPDVRFARAQSAGTAGAAAPAAAGGGEPPVDRGVAVGIANAAPAALDQDDRTVSFGERLVQLAKLLVVSPAALLAANPAEAMSIPKSLQSDAESSIEDELLAANQKIFGKPSLEAAKNYSSRMAREWPAESARAKEKIAALANIGSVREIAENNAYFKDRNPAVQRHALTRVLELLKVTETAATVQLNDEQAKVVSKDLIPFVHDFRILKYFAQDAAVALAAQERMNALRDLTAPRDLTPTIAAAIRDMNLDNPELNPELRQKIALIFISGESGGTHYFQPGHIQAGLPLTSWAGASGLTQLMPDTHDGLLREFRQTYNNLYSSLQQKNPAFGDKADVETNIYLSVFMQHKLLRQFDGKPEYVAVAYNGGPKLAEAYGQGGEDALPAETKAYLPNFMGKLSGTITYRLAWENGRAADRQGKIDKISARVAALSAQQPEASKEKTLDEIIDDLRKGEEATENKIREVFAKKTNDNREELVAYLYGEAPTHKRLAEERILNIIQESSDVNVLAWYQQHNGASNLIAAAAMEKISSLRALATPTQAQRDEQNILKNVSEMSDAEIAQTGLAWKGHTDKIRAAALARLKNSIEREGDLAQLAWYRAQVPHDQEEIHRLINDAENILLHLSYQPEPVNAAAVATVKPDTAVAAERQESAVATTTASAARPEILQNNWDNRQALAGIMRDRRQAAEVRLAAAERVQELVVSVAAAAAAAPAATPEGKLVVVRKNDSIWRILEREGLNPAQYEKAVAAHNRYVRDHPEEKLRAIGRPSHREGKVIYGILPGDKFFVNGTIVGAAAGSDLRGREAREAERVAERMARQLRARAEKITPIETRARVEARSEKETKPRERQAKPVDITQKAKERSPEKANDKAPRAPETSRTRGIAQPAQKLAVGAAAGAQPQDVEASLKEPAFTVTPGHALKDLTAPVVAGMLAAAGEAGSGGDAKKIAEQSAAPLKPESPEIAAARRSLGESLNRFQRLRDDLYRADEEVARTLELLQDPKLFLELKKGVIDSNAVVNLNRQLARLEEFALAYQTQNRDFLRRALDNLEANIANLKESLTKIDANSEIITKAAQKIQEQLNTIADDLKNLQEIKTTLEEYRAAWEQAQRDLDAGRPLDLSTLMGLMTKVQEDAAKVKLQKLQRDEAMLAGALPTDSLVVTSADTQGAAGSATLWDQRATSMQQSGITVQAIQALLGGVTQQDIVSLAANLSVAEATQQQLARERSRLGADGGRTLLVSNALDVAATQRDFDEARVRVDALQRMGPPDWAVDVTINGVTTALKLEYFIAGNDVPPAQRDAAIQRGIDVWRQKIQWAEEDIAYLQKKLTDPDLAGNDADSQRERQVVVAQIDNLRLLIQRGLRLITDLEADRQYWISGELFSRVRDRKLAFIQTEARFFEDTLPLLNQMVALQDAQFARGDDYWQQQITEALEVAASLQEQYRMLEQQLAATTDPDQQESIRKQMGINQQQQENRQLHIAYAQASRESLQFSREYVAITDFAERSQRRAALILMYERVNVAELAYLRQTQTLLQSMISAQTDPTTAATYWSGERQRAEKQIEHLQWLRDNYQAQMTQAEKNFLPLQLDLEQQRRTMALYMQEGVTIETAFRARVAALGGIANVPEAERQQFVTRKIAEAQRQAAYYRAAAGLLAQMVEAEAIEFQEAEKYWSSEATKKTKELADLQKLLAGLPANSPRRPSLERQIANVTEYLNKVIPAAQDTVAKNKILLSSEGTSEKRSEVIKRLADFTKVQIEHQRDLIEVIGLLKDSAAPIIETEIIRLGGILEKSKARDKELSEYLNPNNTAELPIDHVDNVFSEKGIPVSIDKRMQYWQGVLDPNNAQKDASGNFISALYARAETERVLKEFEARLAKLLSEPEDKRDLQAIKDTQLNIEKWNMYRRDTFVRERMAQISLTTLPVQKQVYIQERESLRLYIPLQDQKIEGLKLDLKFVDGTSTETPQAVVTRNLAQINAELEWAPQGEAALRANQAWLEKLKADNASLLSIFAEQRQNINDLLAILEQQHQGLVEEVKEVERIIKELKRDIRKVKDWLNRINSKDNSVFDRIRRAQEMRIDAMKTYLEAKAKRMFSADKARNVRDDVGRNARRLKELGVSDFDMSAMTDPARQRNAPWILSKEKLAEFVRRVAGDPQRPADMFRQLDAVSPSALPGGSKDVFATARQLFSSLGLNLERVSLGGEEYYVATRVNVSGDNQEMYLRLGNMLGSFGSKEYPVRVSGFLYNMQYTEPKRGAIGVGLAAEFDPPNKPIYYGLTVDVYKPTNERVSPAVAGEPELARMMITQDFSMLITKELDAHGNWTGKYKTFLGASLLSDLPLSLDKGNFMTHAGTVQLQHKLNEAFTFKVEASGAIVIDDYQESRRWSFGDPIFPETLEFHKAKVEGKDMAYLFGRAEAVWHAWKQEKKAPRAGEDRDKALPAHGLKEVNVSFFVEAKNYTNTPGYSGIFPGAKIEAITGWSIANLPVETRIAAEGVANQKYGELRFDVRNTVAAGTKNATTVELAGRMNQDNLRWLARVTRQVFGVDIGVGIGDIDGSGIDPQFSISQSKSASKTLLQSIPDPAAAVKHFSENVAKLREQPESAMAATLPYALMYHEPVYNALLQSSAVASEANQKFIGSVDARYGAGMTTAEKNSLLTPKTPFDLEMRLSAEVKGDPHRSRMALLDVRRALEQAQDRSRAAMQEILSLYGQLVQSKIMLDALEHSAESAEAAKSASGQSLSLWQANLARQRSLFRSRQAQFVELTGISAAAVPELLKTAPTWQQMKDNPSAALEQLRAQAEKVRELWDPVLRDVAVNLAVEKESALWKLLNLTGLKAVQVKFNPLQMMVEEGSVEFRVATTVTIYDGGKKREQKIELKFAKESLSAQEAEWLRASARRQDVIAEHLRLNDATQAALSAQRGASVAALQNSITRYNTVVGASEAAIWKNIDNVVAGMSGSAKTAIENVTESTALALEKTFYEAMQKQTGLSALSAQPAAVYPAGVLSIEQLPQAFSAALPNNLESTEAALRVSEAREILANGRSGWGVALDIAAGISSNGTPMFLPTLRINVDRHGEAVKESREVKSQIQEKSKEMVDAEVRAWVLIAIAEYSQAKAALDALPPAAGQPESEIMQRHYAQERLLNAQSAVNKLLGRPALSPLDVRVTPAEIA
ncbi:MAG: hypothetical protein NC924_06380, partial [Candidatus Omnitrophica bacterium]|nr:hypothetical protein [Candidatus Omnitrophota bacterium]